MGSSYTPRYRLDMSMRGADGREYRTDLMTWRDRKIGMIPGYGKPTVENLARFVRAYETSTGPTGNNRHIGPMRVLAAYISENKRDGEIVAEYHAEE